MIVPHTRMLPVACLYLAPRADVVSLCKDRSARQPRFLSTDLPAEGYTRAAYRSSRSSSSIFAAGADPQAAAARAAQCASTLARPNTRAHGSIYANLACEDELVRGVLADPPRPSRGHRVALVAPLAPAQATPALARKEAAARRFLRRRRRRRLRRRLRRLQTVDPAKGTGRDEAQNRTENAPGGVLGACALLRRRGPVDAYAPVLALQYARHPAAAALAHEPAILNSLRPARGTGRTLGFSQSVG